MYAVQTPINVRLYHFFAEDANGWLPILVMVRESHGRTAQTKAFKLKQRY